MTFLDGVLAASDLAMVRAALADARFVDGRATAGATARKVKANLQAAGDDSEIESLGRFVIDALWRHPAFAIAARPAAFSRVLFSRYEPGMRYGAHVDDAMMDVGAARLRTDLAFTVVLEDPEAYGGGALVVHGAAGETRVKLAAGDAFIYPAGTIHEVEPVASGARLAAVGWVQSLVRDAAAREILFDLRPCGRHGRAQMRRSSSTRRFQTCCACGRSPSAFSAKVSSRFCGRKCAHSDI
jgi:PKHD-type hydroxylase